MGQSTDELSELQLQRDCHVWLWNMYPETRGCCWHVTNEMKPMRVQTGYDEDGHPVFATESPDQFRKRIGQAKGAGLVAGVADLHFFWKGRLYVIELKVGKNTASKDQLWWKDIISKHDAKWFEIRYLSEFRSLIKSIIC